MIPGIKSYVVRSVAATAGYQISTPSIRPDRFVSTIKVERWPTTCEAASSGGAAVDSMPILCHESLFFVPLRHNIYRLRTLKARTTEEIEPMSREGIEALRIDVDEVK